MTREELLAYRSVERARLALSGKGKPAQLERAILQGMAIAADTLGLCGTPAGWEMLAIETARATKEADVPRTGSREKAEEARALHQATIVAVFRAAAPGSGVTI